MRSNIFPLVQRRSRFATTSEWEFQLDVLEECVAFLEGASSLAQSATSAPSADETAFYVEEQSTVVEDAQEALRILRALARTSSQMKG